MRTRNPNDEVSGLAAIEERMPSPHTHNKLPLLKLKPITVVPAKESDCSLKLNGKTFSETFSLAHDHAKRPVPSLMLHITTSRSVLLRCHCYLIKSKGKHMPL